MVSGGFSAIWASASWLDAAIQKNTVANRQSLITAPCPPVLPEDHPLLSHWAALCVTANTREHPRELQLRQSV